MYAALNWCQEHHTEIVDTLRTLLGGYPLVMPASIDVMTDDALRDTFERWWKTPSIEAVERHKLYKLAWDITGTEFAGRHMLYEKFYAGSSIVVRNQSDREAPWQSFHDTVDRLLASIEVPGRWRQRAGTRQATLLTAAARRFIGSRSAASQRRWARCPLCGDNRRRHTCNQWARRMLRAKRPAGEVS